MKNLYRLVDEAEISKDNYSFDEIRRNVNQASCELQEALDVLRSTLDTEEKLSIIENHLSALKEYL